MTAIRYIILYTIVILFLPAILVAADNGIRLPTRTEDRGEFSCGLAPDKKSRRIEVISAEQEVSWPRVAELPQEAQTDRVMYSEGCYCIYNGSRYGFITADGEEITPFIYEQAAPFSEGLACVSHHGKYGFIGKDGRTKISFLYDQASSFSEGLAYFCLGEDYGFIDHEGNVVLRPECDSISTFQEGRAYFSIDGLYGYLDQEGTIVTEPIYEDAGRFEDGLAMVVQNGRYGLIGRDGRQILAPEYDWIDVTDGFIRAEKEDMMYCFDRESGKRLTEGWDWIRVEDGMLVVSRGDWYGLLDGNGNQLLQPEYAYVSPISDHGVAIVKKGDFHGVIDYGGRERVPFVYHSIYYDSNGTGGLRVFYGEEQDGQFQGGYGYLFFSEEDAFLEIPPVYDYIRYFQGDLAVVMKDGKYGAIRRNGEVELPVKYDDVELYQNGSISFSTGKLTALYDSDRRLFKSGLYDSIEECGRGYLIRENCRYGLLNERGEQVIPSVYCSVRHNICNTDHILSMTRQCESGEQTILVMTDEVTESGPEDVFFGNYLTPGAEEYGDFFRNGSFTMGRDYTVELSEFPGYRKFGKLYRMREEERPILYLCVWSEDSVSISDGYDGFFVLKDGKVERLTAEPEEDIFLQEGSVCFLYDKEEGRRKLGIHGSRYYDSGGYSGYGKCVYELGEEGAEVSASCFCVSHDIDDYTKEELLENVGLLYDEYNVPYTEESVLKAWDVTEYQVDGKRTTLEHYEEVSGRYKYMTILDLHF